MHVGGSSDIVTVDLTFAGTSPPSAGAAHSIKDVLDLTHDDEETYTLATITESPAVTIPAEPSAAMMTDCDKHTPQAASRAVSAKATIANTAVNMIPSDMKQLGRGELIPELKSALRDVHLDPRILEKAVLHSSPDTVPSWSEEYQRTLLDGDLAYLLQEVQAAGACLAESSATSSTSHGWLGDARGMRAYYLLELWVHRSGLLEFPASFQSLRESLSVSYEKARTVSRIGVYFEYKSFEAARAYVRTFGLKSEREWFAWSKSGARPHDIPGDPQTKYASSGWTSYGDFLGYAEGKVAGSYRSFEDARTYVRTLDMKSAREWEAWRKSGDRPPDIPSDPPKTYKSSGWTSYGDFLGFAVGKVAGSFRTFEDARSYVRQLGLKSQNEWEAWRKSRPHDIPGKPEATYKESGWLSFGDFLGYDVGKVARKTKASKLRTFEDARAYVRTLQLKSEREWQAWRKSGARPDDIPSTPNVTYKESGWTSYGDFLGYADGKVAGSFRSFEDARAYVRTLGLKSREEWEAWSKSGARPHDIPSNPSTTYKSSGWISYPDFLGYAIGKGGRGSFRTFEAARSYVRTLGLKGKMEWEAWRKSGARPYDIPAHPEKTYASSGWSSWGDFLGYAEGKEAIVRKRKIRA